MLDVANSPFFEDAAVLEFFQTSGRPTAGAATVGTTVRVPTADLQPIAAADVAAAVAEVRVARPQRRVAAPP